MECQYDITTFEVNDVDDLRQKLKAKGEAGWELVTVVHSAGFANALLIFKKEAN